MQTPTTRILLVSTSYPRDAGDWRGVFIRHLVAALARRNDLELDVWAPPGDLPPSAKAITLPDEAAWLARLMAAKGISHLMRSGGIRGLVAPLRLLGFLRRAYLRNPQVDAYHVNWLQCALPLPRNGKPALITVLGNDLKLLGLPLVRSLMRRVMRQRRVIICPNAEWMHEPLTQAFGDVADIVPVPFGIDPAWYAITQPAPMHSPPVWLAVTRLTRDKLGPLLEWSEPLFSDGTRQLHLFGPNQEDIVLPQWIHYHGPATPKELAEDWFPRAHGLITLSTHAEGRPQVMLEAMASGLPIIASDMPAHASLVSAATGRLCRAASDYAGAVQQLEVESTRRECGAAARQWVAREIGTWDDCAERYATLYRRLLGATAYE